MLSPAFVGEILWDEFLRDSRRLARHVQAGLVARTGARDLGTQRHPSKRLRVLSDTPVPAALIEVGHLTNGAEERRLRDGAYRQRIAEGIADGLDRFHRGEP